MRVLSTVIGSPSHGRAMLPLLSALAAAKHDVLVAAPPQLVPVFAAEPVRIAEVMADSNEHLTRWFRQIEAISPDQPGEWPENLWIETFAGPHFIESWAALLSLARDFGPDLVVRDGGELGGCLVAEALDLPHVSAPSGAANCINPVCLLPELNERRSQLGLPSTDDPYWIYRYGRIDCMPPQYSFTAYPAPTMLNYRQPAVVDRMETLPPWVAELPTDRPLVIAAVGTALQMLARLRSGGMEIPPTIAKMFDATDVLNAIVTGLSKLDCAALVATGGIVVDQTPQDGNVRLVDYFSQPLLLQCAQLFVTHGGYNSIREAVGAGVPMAVAPRFGDQPTNADRVQALGLGRRIFNAGATPHASDVTATCEWLLNNPQITAQTRRAQRQMLTLPPIEAAVADLELLARQTS